MTEHFTVQGPGFTPVSNTFGEPHGDWTAPIIEELLARTAPQPAIGGVTLKPGQGVLKVGTALVMDANGLYIKATGATAEGLLYRDSDTGTDVNGARTIGLMVAGGIVKLSLVTAANGVVDVETALGGSANENRDTLSFWK